MYAGDALARQRHGLGLFDPIWTVKSTKQTQTAIKAYFKSSDDGAIKAFPDLFLEQCRQMSYYSNLSVLGSDGSSFL